MVETYTIPQNDFDHYNDYDGRSSTIIMDNHSPPTIPIISTTITFTATEGKWDYYYLRTEQAVDFRHHHTMSFLRVKKGNQCCLYFLRERLHYDSRLPPPEAPLSGDQLVDPINR
jgi:hypothetical protein